MGTTSGEKTWWKTAARLNPPWIFGSEPGGAALLTPDSWPANNAALEREITNQMLAQRRQFGLRAPMRNSKDTLPCRRSWASACSVTPHTSSSSAYWFGNVSSAVLILSVSSPGQMIFRSPPLAVSILRAESGMRQHLD